MDITSEEFLKTLDESVEPQKGWTPEPEPEGFLFGIPIAHWDCLKRARDVVDVYSPDREGESIEEFWERQDEWDKAHPVEALVRENALEAKRTLAQEAREARGKRLLASDPARMTKAQLKERADLKRRIAAEAKLQAVGVDQYWRDFFEIDKGLQKLDAAFEAIRQDDGGLHNATRPERVDISDID